LWDIITFPEIYWQVTKSVGKKLKIGLAFGKVRTEKLEWHLYSGHDASLSYTVRVRPLLVWVLGFQLRLLRLEMGKFHP